MQTFSKWLEDNNLNEAEIAKAEKCAECPDKATIWTTATGRKTARTTIKGKSVRKGLCQSCYERDVKAGYCDLHGRSNKSNQELMHAKDRKRELSWMKKK